MMQTMLQNGETIKYSMGQVMAQSSRAIVILKQDKYTTVPEKWKETSEILYLLK